MVARFAGSFGLMRYSRLESQSVEAIRARKDRCD